MFDKQGLPVQPDAALTPVTLPFSILLCLPDYVTWIRVSPHLT
jgi:hypothetical protein